MKIGNFGFQQKTEPKSIAHLKIEKKLHYIYAKGKFTLSQEQRQGPWFKVSFKGLSPEIDIQIRLPVPVLTEVAFTYSIVPVDRSSMPITTK